MGNVKPKGPEKPGKPGEPGEPVGPARKKRKKRKREHTVGPLLFHPESHSYTIEDRPVPSVSEIIAPYGDDIPENSSQALAVEAAAERGTVCHALLESFLKGDADVEYPSSYTAYVQAIQLFLSEHDVLPAAVETPLYSARLGVAGTPDLLCEFDGTLALLDYKFVSQVAKTKVKAQLNAYRLMYEDNGVYVEALYAVQFLPDGAYRLYPVKIDDTEFLTALELHRLKNKKHARGRID